MHSSGPVTCRACGHKDVGNYCSECGRRLKLETSAWAFIGEAFELSWQKVRAGLSTFVALSIWPARYIDDWSAGRRAGYLGPVLSFGVLLAIGGFLISFVSGLTSTVNLPVNPAMWIMYLDAETGALAERRGVLAALSPFAPVAMIAAGAVAMSFLPEFDWHRKLTFAVAMGCVAVIWFSVGAILNLLWPIEGWPAIYYGPQVFVFILHGETSLGRVFGLDHTARSVRVAVFLFAALGIFWLTGLAVRFYLSLPLL